jgi:predicted RNA-binding protein Jag
VKDLVFRGPDVATAVGAAAEALGVSPAGLRYVVLSVGVAPRGIRGGSSAEIVVLADSRPDLLPVEPGTREADGAPLARRLAEIGRALTRASGWDVSLEAEEDNGDVIVEVETREPPDIPWGEEGEVFRALEHLLQRVSAQLGCGRVRIRCKSYRAQRDARLRSLALETAKAVRLDGISRAVACLNSYERRVVHVALAGEQGVRSRSEGAGETRVLRVEAAESLKG